MTTGDTDPARQTVTLISVPLLVPARLCPSEPSDACSPAWAPSLLGQLCRDALPRAELKPAFWKLPPRACMTAAQWTQSRHLLTLRGCEESTTLYPLWLFLGAAQEYVGWLSPLRVKKCRSVVPHESESRLRSACLHDTAAFLIGEGVLVDTHLLRGRVPLSLAAPGELAQEQRDGVSWSKRAALDHVMIAVGR